MANTNSKDLEERLSPWGVSMEQQEAREDVPHGHHSPTPREQLNEKLSTWAVQVNEQEQAFGRSPPRSPERPSTNVQRTRGRESPSSPQRSPKSKERVSPVPKKMRKEDNALQESLSPWGIKSSGGHEDLVLKKRLMREGSEVEVRFYTRLGLQQKLMEWGINTETIEHPEVLTVEQALPHLADFEGVFAKNLFLKDKKKNLYLFCAPHDAEISLGTLARLVGASGGLRLADPEILEQKLGLKQGAVTVFGLINDQFHDVKLIMDNRLLDGSYPRILFHPMVNTATTAISPAGLKSFLAWTGHDPALIDISTESTVV